MADIHEQNPDDLVIEVWNYRTQLFEGHFRCRSERRVRVDYHGDLSDLGVFDGRVEGGFFIPRDPMSPLDWKIDYS